MFIIHIDDTKLTLLEQQSFAVHIVLKTCMFCRSDVIRLDVCENTDFKWNTCRPVQHQPLRRHFHDNTVASSLCHFCEIRLNCVRFRSRIHCRNVFISNDRFNRADQTNLMTCPFQNGFDHIRRCGFSLCSGNTDHFHFFRRIIKICSRDQCHRIAAVCHFDDCHILRNFYFILHNQDFCPFGDHIGCVFVSVRNGSFDAEKQRSLFCFSGVIDKICHLDIYRAIYTFIFYSFQ